MKNTRQLGRIFNIQKFSLNDGPGIRTVIFFKGCPLKCAWCANPESQAPLPQILWEEKQCLHCLACVKNCPAVAIKEAEGKIRVNHLICQGSAACGEQTPCLAKCPGRALSTAGEVKSVEEIVHIARQDEPFYQKSGGGVTLSGGEPLLQPDFALALLQALKAKNIHAAMETTGFASPEVFQRVTAFVDLLLFDIKHWQEEKHRKYTGVSNKPILANLKQAISQGKEVLPRLPIIPNVNDSLDDATQFAQCLKAVGASKIQLLPFHQFGENKYKLLGKDYELAGKAALHQEELEDYRQVFLAVGIEAFF